MVSSKKGPDSTVSLSTDSELDERRGLLHYLSNQDQDIEDEYTKRIAKSEPCPAKNVLITAFAFIALLIFGIFARMFCVMPARWSHSMAKQSGNGLLLSNGTHDFKRTVLIVSIDGLRYIIQS